MIGQENGKRKGKEQREGGNEVKLKLKVIMKKKKKEEDPRSHEGDEGTVTKNMFKEDCHTEREPERERERM